MTPEQEFFTRLTALAKVSGANLTPDIVELYDQGLKHLGYSKVSKAIIHVMLNRRANDRMPSIRDLRELVQPEVSPEQDAVEAVARIGEAMTKFGWANPKDARKFIGELGWVIVEREGGWESICEKTTLDKLPTLRAQWREMAKAVTARAKAGKLNEAPALPEAPGSAKVLALTSRIGKEMACGRDD